MRVLLGVLLVVSVAFAYNVFWGEFIHCDVGSCPYPNPEGKFLEVGPNYAVFDTRGDPSAMGVLRVGRGV
ncbi:MAG: hypothetical protein QW680_09140 [Pyrobaculum sp.]